MADNKVYVVTHRYTTIPIRGSKHSTVDVLGVCKDLEEAKRIAWKEINDSLSTYDSVEDFEITYRASDDQINRAIETLDMAVYMHIDAHHIGTSIVRSVQVYESEMT